jgi:hypothetical protein
LVQCGPCVLLLNCCCCCCCCCCCGHRLASGHGSERPIGSLIAPQPPVPGDWLARSQEWPAICDLRSARTPSPKPKRDSSGTCM